MTTDLLGRTILVTGSTAGLGLASAHALAARGATVILAGRSAARVGAAAEAIRQKVPEARLDRVLFDLEDLSSVERAVTEIGSRFPTLDVLLNNAGLVTPARELGAGGLERMHAANHTGPARLTWGLLPLLRKSADGRVVFVASEAHRFGYADLDDLRCERRFMSLRQYGRTKLYNLLFAAELARRPEAEGLAILCAHPGAVATSLGHSDSAIAEAIRKFIGLFMRTPEKGAETQVWLAADPSLRGRRGYFADRKEKVPNAAARDEALARALWDLTFPSTPGA